MGSQMSDCFEMWQTPRQQGSAVAIKCLMFVRYKLDQRRGFTHTICWVLSELAMNATPSWKQLHSAAEAPFKLQMPGDASKRQWNRS